MNYPDPGDDEREAMRMQNEPWTWQMWVALLLPVVGIGAVVVFFLTR